MGYLLKEGLKTLCGVNQWSYAVLWKFGCQNPKLLIWEDCYYETASCSQLSGNLNSEGAFHEHNGSWVSAETRKLQSVNKVHLLVNKMMMDCQVNIVGEGLVGRVAFTGNHQWIQAENYYREAHPPQVQKELSQQFSAGMQTVVVIPVLPHGVVQFGSFMTITENMGFVNHVASLVHQLGYLTELPKQEFPSNAPQCSFDTFNYVGNSDDSSMVASQTTSFPLSQTNLHHYPQLDLSSADGSAKTEAIPSNTPYSNNLNYNELKNMSFPKIGASRSDSINQFTANPVCAASKREIEQDTQPHSSGDDLFDILGADFKNKLFSNFWHGSELDPKVHNWDTNNKDNLESGIFSSANSDHLLEAVVSKVSPSAKQSADDISVSSSSVPSSSFLYSQYGISNQMKGELFGVPPKFVAKADQGLSKEESGTSYSQGSTVYGSQISSWIGNDQKGKQNSSSVSTGYSKKPDDNGKANRKRLKPGENPRPRPKDRQLIQDRVKELREIVPNGGKCSIDTLLERTIKHMLFLQSVAKHSDKLKQTGESKIISKDGGLVLKDNFEGGATWAYEVGSQSMVCPIIVEDLNQPRQMLVEMLCEERGLFLEIADIIRGIGLTILKGVLEIRDDKIWGRFVVEANRDVTRMEIFISLVRLLEQTVKNIAPQPNAESLTDQQFYQVAHPS